MYLFLTLLSALAFTVGDVFMKHSEGLTRLVPTLLVYLFFVGGASLQARAMRGAELSVTAIVITGLETSLALGIGILYFKEGLSLFKVAGLALIVTGIVVLQQGGD